jgi:hypothetical protein
MNATEIIARLIDSKAINVLQLKNRAGNHPQNLIK